MAKRFMKKIKHPRALKLIKNYSPKQQMSDEIEIYPNGIFQFSISMILEDIESGLFAPKMERINIEKWRKTHTTSSGLNEEHLQCVDTKKPIIQAEIRIGKFEIIDGNHRFEKAFMDGKKTINSYIIYGEELVKYFYDVKGYACFVKYWNSKLEES
jgi:hypothetical protein